jgi:hypothetical protein
MLLENNEFAFHIKVQGEKTKEWFEGDFTIKCILNMQEQMDIAIATDRYNGGSTSLDPNFKLFNRMLAELETRLVRKNNKPLCPTWWSESNFGWQLHDSNIVFEVFPKVGEAEKAWAERLKAKADKATDQAEKNPISKS